MGYEIGATKEVKLSEIIEGWSDEETSISLKRLSDEKALELMSKKDVLMKIADSSNFDELKGALDEIKEIMRQGIVGFKGFSFPNGGDFESQREELISDLPYSAKYAICGAISNLTLTGDPRGNAISSES